MRLTLTTVVVVCAAMPVAVAQAQVIGPLRWQLMPYCNVLTLTVTPGAGNYAIQGTDDQCGGAAPPAGVVGLAFPRPAGDLG